MKKATKEKTARLLAWIEDSSGLTLSVRPIGGIGQGVYRGNAFITSGTAGEIQRYLETAVQVLDLARQERVSRAQATPDPADPTMAFDHKTFRSRVSKGIAKACFREAKYIGHPDCIDVEYISMCSNTRVQAALTASRRKRYTD